MACATLTAELERWKESHRVFQEQFDVLTATLEENSEQLFTSRSELAERRARLSSLLEISARLEDFPAAAGNAQLLWREPTHVLLFQEGIGEAAEETSVGSEKAVLGTGRELTGE